MAFDMLAHIHVVVVAAVFWRLTISKRVHTPHPAWLLYAFKDKDAVFHSIKAHQSDTIIKRYCVRILVKPKIKVQSKMAAAQPLSS